jgi:hypothetical protein
MGTSAHLRQTRRVKIIAIIIAAGLICHGVSLEILVDDPVVLNPLVR